MDEITLLRSKLAREQAARQQAERILEVKAFELYEANLQLKSLNENLEQQVVEGITALRQVEESYRELIDSVEDVIYRISPEGYFTFMSSAVESRLGYSVGETLGRHFTEFVREDYRTRLVQFYQRVLEQRLNSTYIDFPALTRDGQTVWIGQSVRLIERDGAVVNLVAVARDITENRMIQENLLTAQTRLSTLITNLQRAVLVEDEQRRLILVNQQFCDMFSFSLTPEQLVGFDCTQAAEQSKHLFANPDAFVARLTEVLDRQELVSDELIHMADGRVLQRDYVPIFLEGEYRGHLWKYGDVTQQFKASEQIRKSEEKYRGIMNNMELGLVEVDNQHVILRAYDRFCDMVGYTEAELVGRKATELLPPGKYMDVVAENQARRQRREASSYELELVRKDGQHIWSIVSGAPILNDDGDVVGSMGVHYDITERKALEVELAKARAVAEDAREAEKQFLANMSHEIRTPLNAIIGMAHLLFDTRPTRQQYEYLEILKTSADFLHSLISNLLDMAKIEAGRIDVHTHPFDLAGTLRTLQRVFQIKLESRPIELDMTIDERLHEAYIGDDLLLNQILLNLIGNAEKFTERGQITIDVRLIREEPARHWIQFSITDTGVGIAAEKLELIFQKFRQVNAEGHKHKGTGLGLAITRQLVELLTGTIEVTSAPGLGTTFTVALPFEPTGEKLVLREPEQHQIDAPLTDPGQCLILVAEDNVMNQKYISSLLEKWAIPFVIASDGKQAVANAQQQVFTMILMDLQMPVMDGYEATITIRNTQNPNQHTPVIALTASAMIDQKNKAAKAGMNDFISKPFSPNLLLSTIQRYMAINETGSQAGESLTSSPLLDHARIDEIYGFDKAYAAEMFQVFLSDVLPDFPLIQSLILQEDWVELGKLAHKLKPTLGMVGLTGLEKKMLGIERQAKDAPDRASLQEKWEDVQSDLDRSVPVLKQELVKLKV